MRQVTVLQLLRHFRDGDVAIEKAGIEPNTNRIRQDEANHIVESEEEKKTEGGGARRKKYSKNGRKVMSDIVPDEKNQNTCGKAVRGVEHSSGNGCNEKYKPGYTGGRDRQLKERHKGEFRRRQADKKMRSGMF